MTRDELDLLLAHLDGTLPPEDAPRLNRLLLESAGARDRLRAFAAADIALRELAATAPVAEPASWTDRLPFRGLRKPLAWGLAAGIAGSSAVWAWVHHDADGPRLIANLVADGFETPAAPGNTGVPLDLARWGGDHAVIAGPTHGVAPRSGRHMLQVLRSDFVGEVSPTSRAGDQQFLLDLSAHRAVIASGRGFLAAEVWVNQTPPPAGEDYAGSLDLFAFGDDPRVHRGETWRAWLYEEHLGMAGQRQVSTDADPATWERLAATLPLPPGTRFVILHLRMKRREPAPTAKAVEFPGAFFDDVKLDLFLRASPADPAAQ